MTSIKLLAFAAVVATILGAILAVAGTDGSGSSSVGGPSWSFGTVAGYYWSGNVTEVRGEWVVPRIESSRPMGSASTWIGARALGSDAGAPFIQIGTEELHGAPGKPFANVYDAFWSDTRNDFHSRVLFDVTPGDVIGASLYLSDGRWRLAIVDSTSGATASFDTRDEAHAAFPFAEWLQEDVTDSRTNRPAPYPQLTSTRFVSFAVNGASPQPDRLGPVWMSLTPHQFLGPDRAGDSFTVRPMRLSPADEKFLELGSAFSTASYAFSGEFDRWTTSTPQPRMRAEAARFVSASQDFISGLNSVAWPRRSVKPLVSNLISELRRQVKLTQPDALPPPAELETWRQHWHDDSDAFNTTNLALHSQLNVPAA